MTTAYPLTWPEGQPRTPRWSRKRAAFDVTQTRAQEGILSEIKRLGGRDAIISTNIKLRLDGMPYAQQTKMEDCGVAVYFTYKKRPMCFACDKWDQIKDNMRAIEKTIEALRGIERWGSGDMMERAFTGFTALPAPGPSKKPWAEVLRYTQFYKPSLAEAEARYRELAMTLHPDNGGSHEAMSELNEAISEARKELS